MKCYLQWHKHHNHRVCISQGYAKQTTPNPFYLAQYHLSMQRGHWKVRTPARHHLFTVCC